MRLDVYLTENSYCESRKKSSDNIKNGIVFVNGKNITKPAFDVDGSECVEIRGEQCAYVGRGGLKLEKALAFFSISVDGAVCADIGSSTGGFTDCLLQKGAVKVFAIDSGKDQLHKKLRNDSRVVVMEGFNARTLEKKHLKAECDLVVMDVSFISQTLLYRAVSNILKDGGLFVSLIKPQFEAGREGIGKKGIVKDERVRKAVCEKIKDSAKIYGLENINIVDSPILGGDGNKEYLALFKHNKKCAEKN